MNARKKYKKKKILLLSNEWRSRCSFDCLHASDQSILLWHFTFRTLKGSPSLIHPDQFGSCFDIWYCPDQKGTSKRTCTISDGFAWNDRFTSNELHTNVNPLNISQSYNSNLCLEVDSHEKWRSWWSFLFSCSKGFCTEILVTCLSILKFVVFWLVRYFCYNCEMLAVV